MYKRRKSTWAELARKYANASEGATALEYGLLTAILGVGLIAGSDGIANVITTMWDVIATRMDAS